MFNILDIQSNNILKAFTPIKAKEIRHWPSGTYEKQENGVWKKLSEKAEKITITTKYLSQNEKGELVLKDKEIGFDELIPNISKSQPLKIDLDIKLDEKQRQIYKDTLKEAFQIRPIKTNNIGYSILPLYMFREKESVEPIKNFWKPNQPKPNDTFFNVVNYQNVISKLEDYKKEWEKVSDGAYGEGMKYLSQKYLPRINKLLKQSEPLIKYFEEIRDKYKQAIQFNESQLKQIKLTKNTIEKIKQEKYFNTLSEQDKQEFLNKLQRIEEYPETWNYGVFARWTGD